MSCKPIGSPAASKPQGSERPQMPARFTDKVKTSDRYICSGSAAFSPMRKAVVGVVGQAITSTSRNASSKSWRMSVRTCCALR